MSLVDLAPTLAGLLGHPFPAARPLDGRDLSRALLDGGEPAAGEIYAETRYPAVFGWSPLAALRRRDLKYISRAAAGALRSARAIPARRPTCWPRRPQAPEARGFAARLAAIEASAVDAPRAASRPTPRPAPGWRASAMSPAARQPQPAARPGRPRRRARSIPERMVDLFQRFERANDAAAPAAMRRRAASELEALVAADPAQSRSSAASWRAAWRERGETAKALPLYRQAAAAAPRDPEAWYNLASALQEAGQPGEARQAIERALQLDAGRPEAHNTLGIVELAEGNLERARREFARRRRARSARRRRAQQPRQRAARREHKLDEAASAYRRCRGRSRRATPSRSTGSARWRWSAIGRGRHFLISNALWLSPRDTTRSGSTGPSPRSWRGMPAPPLSAYRDFLAATAGDPKFSEQRRAAQQLLARLESRTRGGGPAERR